ncbi:membrane protein [Stylonychia lemnae]|uniref:Membrane protein n=1 Tax=Stylonychia lemnae TaxID=5949 RepID=A0A078A8P7_STYLE|nr:membrane protein [Stylonychia lemnae]|eukprot:CDW78650.1 membrane protein [Stylonychia lemnae]
MTLSSLSCSGLAVAQKALLHNSPIHPFELAYWYGWLLFLVVYANMRYQKIDTFSMSKEAIPTLILRGTIGVCANICFNIALQLISMSKASVLFWTNPIIIAILGRVFLKEKLTYFDWIACFLAFIGVLLIQNPFQSQPKSDDTFRDMMGTFFALLGSVLAGIVGFSVRKLAGRAHYFFPTLSFAFFNILMTPVMMIFKLIIVDNTLVVYGQFEILMIILISVLLYLVLLFQTWAYKYEKAGRLAPILYIQIIVNCLADIMIFRTSLKLNQLLGGLLILTSNLSIAVLKCLNIIK